MTSNLRPLPRLPGNFSKLFISMRYFLLGMMQSNPDYQETLAMLEYSATIHTNTRKDGFTPEFMHQLEIAHLLRTLLPSLKYPAQTLSAIFGHDLMEDYPETRAVVHQRFSPMVVAALQLLNKYDDNGVEKPTKQHFADMAGCPIASVAKAGDRGHNQSSMGGVFSFAKQYQYVQVTKEHILPMVKEARRLFPEQEAVYENLKFLLRTQYNQAMVMLEAVGFDPDTGLTKLERLQAEANFMGQLPIPTDQAR